jgi:hypothetical protein
MFSTSRNRLGNPREHWSTWPFALAAAATRPRHHLRPHAHGMAPPPRPCKRITAVAWPCLAAAQAMPHPHASPRTQSPPALTFLTDVAATVFVVATSRPHLACLPSSGTASPQASTTSPWPPTTRWHPERASHPRALRKPVHHPRSRRDIVAGSAWMPPTVIRTSPARTRPSPSLSRSRSLRTPYRAWGTSSHLGSKP